MSDSRFPFNYVIEVSIGIIEDSVERQNPLYFFNLLGTYRWPQVLLQPLGVWT